MCALNQWPPCSEAYISCIGRHNLNAVTWASVEMHIFSLHYPSKLTYLFFIPFGVTMRRPHTRTDAAVSAVGDRFLLENSFPYATPIQTDTTLCARKICTPNGMAGSGCCRWDWKVSLLSYIKLQEVTHLGSIHLSAKITFRAESSGAVPKFWLRDLAQKNVRHKISAWNISAWNFDMKNLPEFPEQLTEWLKNDWKISGNR